MKNFLLAALIGAPISALAVTSLLAPVTVRAQSASLTLEQRVQRVEDELAIRRVLVDYASTQDARDYPAYAALFARDGEWVNGRTVHKGRAAIQKMLVDLYGMPPPGFINGDSFHLTFNPEIELKGDRATVRSRHVLFLRGPKGEPITSLSGRYEDEFIRQEGKCKILRRVDFPVMPTAEEWLKFIRERNASR